MYLRSVRQTVSQSVSSQSVDQSVMTAVVTKSYLQEDRQGAMCCLGLTVSQASLYVQSVKRTSMCSQLSEPLCAGGTPVDEPVSQSVSQSVKAPRAIVP